MRIALGIEYDGSAYHGWQRQDPIADQRLATVQTTLETAIGKIAAHRVSIICAGRTDKGVHATGQVVHFETEVQRSERAWVFGTNSELPKDISVRWAKPVSDEFHARFSAVARQYHYLIYNDPVRSPLYYKRAAWHCYPLDVRRMQQAADYFVGTHDFAAFQAAGCQAKSSVKTIHHLRLTQQKKLIKIDIKANAFLYHMVRNIAGVLMAIGEGKEEVEWAEAVLKSMDRKCAGVTAPAQGLYLTSIEYPNSFNLPNQD